MARLIDEQVSQNASTAGSISIPLSSTPALYGTLGLNTSTVGPTLRVEFTTTVGISSIAQALAPITIEVYRGTGPGRVLVYSATEAVEAAGTLGLVNTKVFTFTGIDYLPSNPGFLIYQAFVSGSGVTIGLSRTGPESFNAQAYSD
jgi:hypothetical protein